MALALSAAGELLTLSRVARDGSFTPAGRSYDGEAWDKLEPLLLNFSCDDASSLCAVALDATVTGTFFLLEGFNGTSTARAAVARFLTQATFGPTLETINTFGVIFDDDDGNGEAKDRVTTFGAIETWVEAQMALPPSLLRAYHRRRASPRLRHPSDAASVRDRCDAGSRWLRYAFTNEDRGKTIIASVIAGAASNSMRRWLLTVDGFARTEVEAADFNVSALGAAVALCEVGKL